MPVHRLRRWPGINPTLSQRRVFAGPSAIISVITSKPVNRNAGNLYVYTTRTVEKKREIRQYIYIKKRHKIVYFVELIALSLS